MTATVIRSRSGPRLPWSVRLLVLGVVAACIAGIALSVSMLRGDDPFSSAPRSADAGPAGIGDDVRASFGYIAVEHAETISGLSEADVTGAHGVPGLVEAGTISVQVAATMTNLTSNVMRYSPDQFELLDGARNVIPLTRAPQLPGELQPNAAIDVLLEFVTTTNARPFRVRFVDPATGRPLLIDLGTVGCTLQSGNGRPLPVQGGCAQPPSDHHDE